MTAPAQSPRKTKPSRPHPRNALSAAFCRSVAQPGRYCDGNGLYLHVESSGARHWVQRLVIHGKGCALGLGSFALVPLAEARQRALANRRVARSGGDPRPAARHTPGVPTFDEAVATVLAIHGAAWKSSGRNANSWQATLRDYASPHLGRKAVDRVTTADVMAVLLPIWTRKHATAQKVRQRIGTVMKWAIAQGYRADNPAGDALTAALPKRSVPVRHQRALPHGEVSGAVAAVRASASWAGLKLVFEFLVLTAARSAEARLATWEEIDPQARVWTVPASRTKAGREHRVPLCSRVIEIVGEARRLGVERTAGAPAELVFPSQRGKAIGDARLSGVLQQLGIGAVPHGFRSSFRDWASERTDHPREVIEAALAHVVRNQTEAAYARSDLFERRRLLMDDWMDYLNGRRQ
ncbi:MAG: tyrosine-type recombinase/integrase [Rhodospirillaceae bacterium]|nr:tyrosine-type recombinase/integrase [Rhodospirillaceae bacterium]